MTHDGINNSRRWQLVRRYKAQGVDEDHLPQRTASTCRREDGDRNGGRSSDVGCRGPCERSTGQRPSSAVLRSGVRRAATRLFGPGGVSLLAHLPPPRRPAAPASQPRQTATGAPWLSAAELDATQVVGPMQEATQHETASFAPWAGKVTGAGFRQAHVLC